MIFDADFFWYFTLPEAKDLRSTLLKHSGLTILTPNKVEFKRMSEYFLDARISEINLIEKDAVIEVEPTRNESLYELCKKLNHSTIIQKVAIPVYIKL